MAFHTRSSPALFGATSTEFTAGSISDKEMDGSNWIVPSYKLFVYMDTGTHSQTDAGSTYTLEYAQTNQQFCLLEFVLDLQLTVRFEGLMGRLGILSLCSSKVISTCLLLFTSKE